MSTELAVMTVVHPKCSSCGSDGGVSAARMSKHTRPSRRGRSEM
eukprot:CAMPEP_0182805620 /NCGR_PEP_ID=MMETSP0006_2-20121128/5166_1 /TAXON_ID=97485 /ORGANISM="Prymnesium parvum, Strain Texoma1" /LENGTH=43 /DNA_ID= /DNA_START= /DNA_END= /DNA_ORIENTATION=